MGKYTVMVLTPRLMSGETKNDRITLFLDEKHVPGDLIECFGGRYEVMEVLK